MRIDQNARGWTPHEIRRAAELWAEHFTSKYGESKGPIGSRSEVCALIAHELKRSIGSIQARLHARGPAFAVKLRSSMVEPRKPADVFTDRQLRADARDRMNLTGSILGDPPPGYSALDERTSGARP